MSRGDGDEGFLSRWSRRKRTGEEDVPPETPPAAPETAAAERNSGPAPVPDEDEAATLERLGLPDPDTLEQGADFSVFMRAAVPEAIRRRALRRLWRSNPTLAVLDGLNDYDDDFSGGFVKPGGLKTAYKVGRGFLDRIAEETEEADGIRPAEDGRPAPVASSLRAPDVPRPPAPEDVAQDVAEDLAEDVAGDSEPAVVLAEDARQDDTPGASADAPARRRMSFRFPDDQT